MEIPVRKSLLEPPLFLGVEELPIAILAGASFIMFTYIATDILGRVAVGLFLVIGFNVIKFINSKEPMFFKILGRYMGHPKYYLDFHRTDVGLRSFKKLGKVKE
jgi:type IV secretory pathway TrbD component